MNRRWHEAIHVRSLPSCGRSECGAGRRTHTASVPLQVEHLRQCPWRTGHVARHALKRLALCGFDRLARGYRKARVLPGEQVLAKLLGEPLGTHKAIEHKPAEALLDGIGVNANGS